MKDEAEIRRAIAHAEESARQEEQISKLCRDPRNVEFRRQAASVWREVAGQYREELALLFLSDERAA